MATQKIKASLWFDGVALEACEFYVSLLPNSRINSTVPGPTGEPLLVDFTLASVDYVAMNGGPHFKFTEAISLIVDCDDQAEVDRLWAALCDGGQAMQCGWLKDKYGLSWQIVPAVLPQLMTNAEPAVAQHVMGALMTMTKIEIQPLMDAAKQAS